MVVQEDKNVNYYIIITSQDDFEIDILNKLNVIGLPDRNEATMKNKLKIGDKIVFYITKKCVFGGIVEVTGDYFYSKSIVWSDPYDVWPHRRGARPLHLIRDFNKMIYIKEIWDDLPFIKNKHNWGVFLQGSFRSISKIDYMAIESAFKKLR